MKTEIAIEELYKSIRKRYESSLERINDNENFDNLLKLDSTLFYYLFKNFQHYRLDGFAEKLSIFETLEYNIEDDGELNLIYVEYCYEMENVSEILGRKFTPTHRQYFIVEREWEYISKELVLDNLISKNSNNKIKTIHACLFNWDDLKWFTEIVQPLLDKNELDYEYQQSLPLDERRKYLGDLKTEDVRIEKLVEEHIKNHRHYRNLQNFVDREQF